MNVVAFTEDFPGGPAVRGFLHQPPKPTADALVLTHGAGSNCQSALLRALATAFADAGLTVLRCDLPFRQARAKGPPLGTSALDREGLKRAVDALRRAVAPRRIFLGGHSYGGRQTTMLVADEPGLVDGLLLLSYPLHPPKRPEQLRTAHLPRLRAPALFVHGTRDPFGSLDEMRAALALIAAPTMLVPIDGAGHELRMETAAEIVTAFREFTGSPASGESLHV